MDYRIEALAILLNEDCLLQRYVPLIPYRDALMENLTRNQVHTKAAWLALSDDALLAMGLPDAETVTLFRHFLVMYDAKESKMKEIEKAAADEAQAAAFRTLYLLPGVKAVRAGLYYDAGYDSLSKIASASVEQIICDTSSLILQKGLSLKAPLPKEVRTHIAVARAFTLYGVSSAGD